MDNEVVFHTSLQIGDHDSLLLFGSEAQQNLREFSKMLSVLLMNSSGDLECLIRDLLDEIDNFQQFLAKKKTFPFLQSKTAKRNHLIKKYDSVLICIDKMNLALKLQEAQLIKNTKILEKMKSLIAECCDNLEASIAYGRSILDQKPINIGNENENWYDRLSKKIDDLEISHTVSLQSQTQLLLMQENNEQLIDKIMAAVSGTIPIWRNQVTMLLGIERMNRNLEVQNRVAEITNSYIDKPRKNIEKMNKKDKEIDIDKLLEANEKLKSSMDNLVKIENKDSCIRLELNNSFV